MTNFTVIGAKGFVGSRLVRALSAEGRELYSPARDDPALFERDLGCVFYCAGLTGDFMARPFDTVDAHVGLIARILRHAKFDRLVYLSSTRVYDGLGERGGREEDILEFDVPAPRSVYDLSKALGENLCLARSEGRGVVARLANVFDWSEDAGGFLSELLRRARTERSIPLTSAPQAGRDYIHIDDVIPALLAIAEGPERLVNVASGENTSNAELGEIFDQAGWQLTFSGGEAPPPGPVCDVSRLAALGVEARSPRAVLASILASPGFYIG